MQASSVVKRQLTLDAEALRRFCQAAWPLPFRARVGEGRFDADCDTPLPNSLDCARMRPQSPGYLGVLKATALLCLIGHQEDAGPS